MRERRMQRMDNFIECSHNCVAFFVLPLFNFLSFLLPFLVARCPLPPRWWCAQLMSKCFSSVLLFCLPWLGLGLGLYKLFTDRLISTGPRPMQHALIFGSQGPTTRRTRRWGNFVASRSSAAALVDIKTKWKSEANERVEHAIPAVPHCGSPAVAATHIYIHIHTDIHINESFGEIIQLRLTSASFGQCRRQRNVYECVVRSVWHKWKGKV